MMHTYREFYNLPYETDLKNYKFFLKTQRLADIDARLRALSLMMIKKMYLHLMKKKEGENRLLFIVPLYL